MPNVAFVPIFTLQLVQKAIYALIVIVDCIVVPMWIFVVRVSIVVVGAGAGVGYGLYRGVSI